MFNTKKTTRLYFKERFGIGSINAKRPSILARALLPTALALVVFAAAPVEIAAAQSSPLEFGKPGGVKVRTVDKKVAKTPSPLPQKALKVSYLGRAPYICTPSGFGRTSRCFAR